MIYLAIFLILYGIVCVMIGGFKKPAKIWNMGKIEAFKKLLGDVGTQIFIGVWGLAALVVGIILLV